MKDKSNSKKFFNLKTLSLLFLFLFLGSCVLISETNLNETLELVVAISAFVFLGLSIILFIFYRKSRPRTAKEKLNIDDNILIARKIYKDTIKKTVLKLVKFVLIFYFALMLSVIIYYIINFDKLMLIILSIATVVMGIVLAVSMYFSYKLLFFPYKEFVLKDESIVVFMTDKHLSRYYYEPCLHVVYDGKEYTEQGRTIWTGGSGKILDEVLFASLHEILDWFDDVKFSNFIKIKINTKNSGPVQCVYKIGTRKFLVSDKLEKLEGCFETSRSMVKEKRKKSKKNSK